MEIAPSSPLSLRSMIVRCAQGQAQATYRWYRPASAAKPLDPSAVTRSRNEVVERTKRPSESLGTRSSTFHSRSEEHTSELQSRQYLVCRLLLEKKNSTG